MIQQKVSLVVFVICFCLIACKSKVNSIKVVEPILFDYPDNMQLNDEQKKVFQQKLYKGRQVYELVCAECHNVQVDGKMVPPDFSLPQLMDYEMRIQYPAHQERLTQTKLTAEELDLVVDFLRYRKKSGKPFK